MSVTSINEPRGGGRRPPHDLHAEASLLGAMLLSRDAVAVASEWLTTSDFYKPAHGHIFDAITTLSASGEPVDVVTVSSALEQVGILADIGGRNVLLGLVADVPATTSAVRYARDIADCAALRRLIAVAGELAEMGYDGRHDVRQALDRAEARVFELTQRNVTDSAAFIGSLLDPALDRLEQLYEKGDAITGLASGFVDLDDLTSGLQPGALYVLGARPAMGKTSLALNIATSVALRKVPTLVFSLEMGQMELSMRILCSEAQVDSKRLRNGQLVEKDWERIAHASGRLANIPLCIDDNPDLTIMELRAKARRFKARVNDLGLIVVDYLQLMTGRSSAENRQVEVAEISRGLKILARELQCPVIALSQLSRGLEGRGDKRPVLSDLRESGSLEQDSDVVMFAYRDEVYNAESPDRGTAELIIAKHRNGPTGSVRLAFLGQYTKFTNLARSHA